MLLLLVSLSLGSTSVCAVEEERNVDPFESANRAMFAINDQLDRFVVRPLALGYDFVMPGFAQRGVGNFFANLYDVNAGFNSILQGRFEGAAQGGGRFLVNSTIGVFGLFDVATPIGIRPYRTDFGHTLAIWGIKPGPYLMVPFFGPRTMRSGTGTIVDTYASVQYYIDSVPIRNTLWGMELVDVRARLLQADQLMSGDRYIFVRDAYLQQREYFVNDGVVEDGFSDFGDEEEWEEF